jgi:hypothetical protein
MREIMALVENRDPKTYEEAGIEPEAAARFAKMRLQPVDAAFYIRLTGSVEGAFERLEQERLRGVLRRAETSANEKLIRLLPQVAKTTGPLSYRSVCALIANDDELFSALCSHVQNADVWDERPEMAARMRHYLGRIKPTRSQKLYRGECRHRGEPAQGFRSWSISRKTAEDFTDCGRAGGRLLAIDRPVQGVAIGDVAQWRNWLRDQNHYGGHQGEWLVLDQPEQYEDL